MKVFVDTAAWIALLNTKDDLHCVAVKVRDRLQQQKASLVTTEFILIEVADALCSSDLRQKTVNFIDRLRQIKNLQIVPVSEALLAKGWALYSQRPDKDWGLTDCISFVVMTQAEITQAFTSDRHFEQAGFMKLL
jgi:hypothetical protein